MNVAICSGVFPHQSPGAEQDHEDDEGLEPAVLHDLEAGLPQPPPGLAQTPAGAHLTAPTVPHADWGRGATLIYIYIHSIYTVNPLIMAGAFIYCAAKSTRPLLEAGLY